MAQTDALARKNLVGAARAVWPFLAAVMVLRLAALLYIPFGRSVEHHLEGLNDEPAHFNYVKYLAVHRAFPVLEHSVTEPDAFTRNEFEYHQAPLYYLLCAPFCALPGDRSALTACRLLSLFFGMASLLVIALILRDCGLPARVQQAAVLFAGLLPSHLYFTVLVSNDALSWLFALLLTRSLLRYGTSGEGTAAVMTGMYLAAGALTKGSLLLFFPLAAGVFMYRYGISGKRSHLARGSLAVGLAALVISPWYARTIVLYHSLLGTPSASGDAFFSVPGLYGFLKLADKYLWFPMQHLEGGGMPYFVLCAVGALVIGAHALAAVWYFGREGRRSFAPVALSILLLANMAAYAWYFFFTAWGNPETRFLFPALGAIVFFFVVPAYKLFVRFSMERLFLPYFFLIGIFPYIFLFFTG